MSYEVKTLHLMNGWSDDYLQKEIIERSKDNRIAYMAEDIVLNTECVKQLAKILEKQQEEIKVLDENLQMSDGLLAYITDVLGFPEDTIISDEFAPMLNEKYISKDKIREKIKELEELLNNEL